MLLKQAKQTMSKINKCPIIPQKEGTITNQLGSSLTKATLSPFHTESVPAIWSSTKSSYPHIIIVHIQTGPLSIPPLCHTVQHVWRMRWPSKKHLTIPVMWWSGHVANRMWQTTQGPLCSAWDALKHQCLMPVQLCILIISLFGHMECNPSMAACVQCQSTSKETWQSQGRI